MFKKAYWVLLAFIVGFSARAQSLPNDVDYIELLYLNLDWLVQTEFATNSGEQDYLASIGFRHRSNDGVNFHTIKPLNGQEEFEYSVVLHVVYQNLLGIDLAPEIYDLKTLNKISAWQNSCAAHVPTCTAMIFFDSDDLKPGFLQVEAPQLFSSIQSETENLKLIPGEGILIVFPISEGLSAYHVIPFFSEYAN